VHASLGCVRLKGTTPRSERVQRDSEPPCGSFARTLFPRLGLQRAAHPLSHIIGVGTWRTSPYDEIRHPAGTVKFLYSTFYVWTQSCIYRRWDQGVTIKIDLSFENRKTILKVSGRINAEGVLELKRQLDEVTEAALDLKEVIRVDLEAVRFLGACVVQGIELRNCPPYISEWIRGER
jgi:hypothetical protein